jgi:hypothetical protein
MELERHTAAPLLSACAERHDDGARPGTNLLKSLVLPAVPMRDRIGDSDQMETLLNGLRNGPILRDLEDAIPGYTLSGISVLNRLSRVSKNVLPMSRKKLESIVHALSSGNLKDFCQEAFLSGQPSATASKMT